MNELRPAAGLLKGRDSDEPCDTDTGSGSGSHSHIEKASQVSFIRFYTGCVPLKVFITVK